MENIKRIGKAFEDKPKSNICLEKDGNLSFEPNENCEICKTYFGSFAHNLLKGIPAATNIFGIDSVHKYYEHLNLNNKEFAFRIIEITGVLKVLQNIEPSKSAGLNVVNGIFLKDGAIVLAELNRDIFNLSIK